MSVNTGTITEQKVGSELPLYSNIKEENTNNTTQQVQSTTGNEKEETAAVYEKTQSQTTVVNYAVNKMTKEQRDSLVEKLKADQESRQQSLVTLVQEMMSKQTKTFSLSVQEDDIWSFLASEEYEVDEETQKKAQEDVAEDGYYGVAQTSQRLFDFACALAGDDVDNMKMMQEAMEEGYKRAEKAWGGELPKISQKTLEAANKMFDDYYASKQEETASQTTTEI